MNFCSKLPHQNIAGFNYLTAELFYAAPLGITVTTILGTSACFLMSHN
jgi:hypothetical protein